MSQAVHLIAKNVPDLSFLAGCGLSDGGCLPCSGVSGRAAAVSPSHVNRRFHSQVKIGSLKCASTGTSFICKASSGGHKRNPDFSRQNRHGFSRNRNRQNEERESFENFDQSDALSSKNGPLLSLSSTPKFQATAGPGPREKEIVELFRKVQAQLRERAAIKKEKKVEALQGKDKESETVDSLLKLLRKHSVEQSKNSSTSSSKDFMDQPGQNDTYNEGKSTSLFNSISSVKDDAEEHNASSLTRPPSNFQRKSPVPRMKYQPIYSGEDTVNSTPHVNSSEEEEENKAEIGFKPEQESEIETDSEPELELEPEFKPKATFPDGGLAKLSEDESSDTDEPSNDEDEGTQLLTSEHGDLSALKLPELRALAKSRGMKGFSKMKKGDLVELLSGSLV